MTTLHAATYHLPRNARIAAAVQLAGLVLLSWLTTMWAMLIVMFTGNSGEHSQSTAGLLLAIVVALPAPTTAVALIVALVPVRRRGAPPLVRFEIATCTTVGALLAVGALAVGVFGQQTTWLEIIVYFGAMFAVYAGLAAAVVGAIRRQARL